MTCERCRELHLLIDVRATAVAGAGELGSPPFHAALGELHAATASLVRHKRFDHVPRREAPPPVPACECGDHIHGWCPRHYPDGRSDE